MEQRDDETIPQTDKEARAEAIKESPEASIAEKISDMGQPSVQKGSAADPDSDTSDAGDGLLPSDEIAGAHRGQRSQR